MASPVPENCAGNIVGSDIQGIEVSEIDSAILMSLLEESQGEERDEDRLNSLIRSLEEEINSNAMDSQNSSMKPDFIVEDGQLCIVGNKEGHDCMVSQDQLEFGLIDMEPETSSPSDDMNWYMDLCENEMDGIIEVGGLSDYSHMYYGVSLEEQGYRSLWQETYDTVIYN
ncbi:uncharacterized protein LOC126720870 [Quercus robur]|uniref:uncharacterized protein LOC126720870 n=1 Tax=Quercus robur TaxID=38942 RepID=UPI00216240A6|nr:uncharacterized protein LOC126720870 [Quercus robur]